eukprot:992359_1
MALLLYIFDEFKDSTKFLRRSIKNEINNYDKGERLVRALTSSNAHEPPSTQMLIKLKVMTTDPNQFTTIVQMLFKRLKDYKYIRHVDKSLICIEYLIKHADITFVTYCQQNIDSIQKYKHYRYKLKGFNGVSNDYGGNIRKTAKRITDLLSNERKLPITRAKAQGYYPTELEDQKLQKELQEINAILNRTKKNKKINKQQNINNIFPENDGDEWMVKYDKLSQQTTDEIDIFGINYSDSFFCKSNDKNKQVENIYTMNNKNIQPQQSKGFDLF